MGKSSAPSVPDPTATASAQANANASTAATQAALNFVNQITPYGATIYDQTGSYTNPEGQTVPRYTQYTSLSPLGQSILTGEQNVASSLIPAAEGVAGQAASAVTKPLDFNTPYTSTLNAGPQQLNTQAANAIYGQQKSFLDPQWGQSEQQLQDQLSRQGIPVGSDAYNNAMTNFNNSRTQAYQSAADSAIAGGSSAANNLFNLALAGQQQNIGQQQLGQTNALSNLQALFGASPQTPTQPIAATAQTQVSPTDIIGATNAATNANMNAYNINTGQTNATMGALGSLGAAGLMAF